MEYERGANTELDEASVIKTLISVIILAVKYFVGVAISSTDVVDLVATTETKMSHHLIVHLPGIVFENNLVCGHLVRLLHQETRAFVEDGNTGTLFNDGELTREQASLLFIRKSDGTKKFVSDLAVYMKNRQFRILDSSKFQKDNFLRIYPQSKYPLPTDAESKLEKTLVCVSGEGCEVLREASFIDNTQLPGPSRAKRPHLGNTSGSTAPPSSALDDFVLQFVRQSNPSARLGSSHTFLDGQ